ncbi:MAG: ComEC family competence protein [Chitinophagaceae bacterium]|nr:MAG: ComEC family competence protein [Chitinophagaceae bacterium]
MKRWPLKDTFFWESAPFFRLLLPLIVGVAFYGHINVPVNGILTIGLSTAGIYIATGLVKTRGVVIQCLYLLSLQLLFICAGWLLSYANDDTQQSAFFGKHLSEHKYFEAIVTETPAEKPRTYKVTVEIVGIVDSNGSQPASGKGLVYVYKNEDSFSLKRGDTVLLTDAWQPIKNAGNPYEFDYAQYAARNNIHYQQFIPIEKIKLIGRSGKINIIDRVHNACMVQLAKYLPDRKTLGLMQAMLIGDEVNLDNDTRQSYSETGIVHIIAISGSHITFFFVLISFCLGWIRNKKYHWLKYLLALPLIWFYVLMAGAAPSAVRAAVMFSLLAIGFALQKQPNSLNQLFATAFILLCIEPMWLYSIGFQLSFLAVLSLVLFYRHIYNWLPTSNKIVKAIWSAIAASLAAELLVAPLVVYYFHLFPLWFIVANLAAWLFMGMVLVAGILVIVCSAFPLLAKFLGSITILLVTWFNKLVVFFQTYNPRSFSFLNVSNYELLLIYFIITTFAVFLLKKQRVLQFISIAGLIALFVLLGFNWHKASQQKRIVVYNIGYKTYIELIEGKYHIPLTNDTLAQSQYNYCVKPAHIQWHAWKQKPRFQHSNYYKIGNASITIAESSPIDSAFTNVTYLVITHPYQRDELKAIQDAYHPQKLIISSNLSRRQTATWINACKQAEMPVHAVANGGAFILSAH